MSSRLEAKAAARAAREVAERRAGAAQTRTRRLKRLAAALIGAGVIVLAAVLISQGNSSKTAKPHTAAQSASLFTGIKQSGVVLGDPKAPVTVTEYADLQCPFCQQFTTAHLPTVVKDYVRTGKARVVFRNLSFIGPDSQKAAQFAAAAGLQNKLWDFVDRFYANQQTENSGYVTDAFLKKVAAEVPGLNATKAFSAVNSSAVAQQLASAQQQAKSAGVNSTPTFVINGKSYSSADVMQALQSATKT
jgi:protein-disulfide isomerase